MGARSLLPIAVTALALAPAGCSDNPGPVDGVRAAASTFLQNCAEGEGVAASEGLTEATREEFVAESDVLAGCRRVLGTADSGTPTSGEELRSARVVEADEHGGIGSAEVELPGGLRRRIEAENVEGRWLLALPPLQP
jgi:hypothetical protein